MRNYWLLNVRLENGYIYNENTVVGTETKIQHIRIEAGKIAEITNVLPEGDYDSYDAKGMLMLPSFKEMHIHIDKTYFGGAWRAVRPVTSIFERIKEEEKLLPELLPTAKGRALHMLETVLNYGSTHVRAHTNIDPSIGLKNLEVTVEAFETYQNKLSHEIVAFPQHGLLRSNMVEEVRQALRSGATHVGGVDPSSVDGDIERSLNTIMDLAVEANAGIDIHLHDGKEAGLKTLQKLADLTEEAGWKDRVTVSHCFALADMSPTDFKEISCRFAKLGISVASTVPFGKIIMPLPELNESGVPVYLGTDSINDHWSPFGNGDNLEKAGLFAELYGNSTEQKLSQTLGFITGGKTPLNQKGEQVWPKIGDEANIVFVEASCSAEAVARRSHRKAVIYQGRLVAGNDKD